MKKKATKKEREMEKKEKEKNERWKRNIQIDRERNRQRGRERNIQRDRERNKFIVPNGLNHKNVIHSNSVIMIANITNSRL